jgi:hypothetical protein
VSTTTTPPAAPATAPAAVPAGREGEVCSGCGRPLAVDQRYCLECGTRRGHTRVPLATPAPAPADAAGGPGAPGGSRSALGGEWTPLTAIGLVAVIALILVAGILIGRGGSDDGGQVVQAGGGGTEATNASADAGGAFKSDWPSGKKGFAIELGTLPKDGTSAADVTSAKDDAAAKGAPDVGALDSDEYASLPSGNYVIYSGVFDDKAAANKALKDLKGDFPDAQVVKVSTDGGGGGGGGGGTASDTGAGSSGTVDDSTLNSLEGSSGEDYVNQSKKLPDDTALPGKPPPKDNKAPGGGTDAIEF